MSEMLMQAVSSTYPEPEAVPPEEIQIPVSRVTSPHAEVMRVAEHWFQKKGDWVVFFREVLGVDGVVRRMFPTAEQLTAFEQTQQFAELQQMVAKLREQPASADEKEPTRVITVRMPKSLHESLREEAQEKRTSMNQLCISKLLQMIDGELIPSE